MPARLNEAVLPPEPAYVSFWRAGDAVQRRRVLGPLDPAELARDAAQRPRGAPLRISVRRPVAPTVGWPGPGEEQEEWVRWPDGRRVWRMEFELTGAEGVRVHFTGVELPEGVALVLYGSPGSPDPAVGYERATLGGRAEFWSATVFDSRVSVECQVPAGVDLAGVSFRVDALLHRYWKSGADDRG
ncbi:MAG: hypothetical protein ACKOET_14555, partial [Verrucomicrobiota bacterium]